MSLGPKDPGATLEFGFNFAPQTSAALTAAPSVVATLAGVAAPELAISNVRIAQLNEQTIPQGVVARVGGGANGAQYLLTASAEDADGNVMVFADYLLVQQCIASQDVE